MSSGICADEAKTRRPGLPRQVKAGKRFTITHRGKAVADLVPAADARATNAAAAIERFQAFMRENLVVAPDINVRKLIDGDRA